MGGREGGSLGLTSIMKLDMFCALVSVLVSFLITFTVVRTYRTASLLRPARCYPPPPIFGQTSCTGLFTSITRPPPTRVPLHGAGLRSVVHSRVCTRVASVRACVKVKGRCSRVSSMWKIDSRLQKVHMRRRRGWAHRYSSVLYLWWA